jgi:heterodisulfide reductase subunit C
MSEHTLPRGSLAARVAEVTGVSPLVCYQCGRCSAGCLQNTSTEMDLSPTRVLRLLQLEAAFHDGGSEPNEFARRLMGSDTPWLCAGCQACTTRCPQGVDIAGIMDVVRQEALQRGLASRTDRAQRIQALHRVFLQGALRRGRIHELMMVGMYKLNTFDFFTDVMLGPAMYLKGKLHLLPPKGADTSRVLKAIETMKRRKTPEHAEGGHHG